MEIPLTSTNGGVISVLDLDGTLLALDLDGTLARSDGQVSSRSIATLLAARAEGAVAALFTRRSSSYLCRQQVALLNALDIASCGTGAYLLYPRTATEQILAPLPDSLVRALSDYVAGQVHGVYAVAYEQGGRFVGGLRFAAPEHWQPIDAVWEPGDPLPLPLTTFYLQRCSGLGAGGVLSEGAWVRALPEALPGVRRVPMTHGIVKYERADVDKGTSLRRVVNELRPRPLRIIAVGNALDDVPLFREADMSYCVGNAPEILDDHALRLRWTNDEDAVALLLGEYRTTPLALGRAVCDGDRSLGEGEDHADIARTSGAGGCPDRSGGMGAWLQ